MREKIQIIPQNERVLVEPIEVKNTTESGLVIVSGGEDKIPTTFGTILEVSETMKEFYSIGETIYYNAKAGVQFRFGGKNLVLLTKGEILAKIKVDNLAQQIDARDLA
jgi:co-chaperonin GroES (HSP10)